ncbi:MAG TPA: hypothetical protein ENI87_04985, partial [bacterium]|nr:hypothetical protein [bacterium]
MRSAVAIAMLAAVGHAQIDWQVHGARTRARVVQQGGEIQVHFPVQGGGKPASLAFPAEAGAHVVVACEREPRARERAAERARELRLAEDSVCRRGIEGDSLRVRTAVAGEDAPGDYRVQATVEARERGTFGLVGRSRDGQGRYLFAIDWQRRVATLERWLDSDHVVLARAELERLAAAPTLMLQLEGFRLSAFLDDEPVLRALDGALRAGAPGVAWQGDEPLVRDLRIAPPVPQTASAALVQRSRVAFLYARVTVPP